MLLLVCYGDGQAALVLRGHCRSRALYQPRCAIKRAVGGLSI